MPVTPNEKKRVNPIAFDFERLFLVSQRLMYDVDKEEDLSEMCTSVFASQFATLEGFSFLKRVKSPIVQSHGCLQSSADPLKSAKYICSVDHGFATQLAEGLKLNLPDYLDKHV